MEINEVIIRLLNQNAHTLYNKLHETKIDKTANVQIQKQLSSPTRFMFIFLFPIRFN